LQDTNTKSEMTKQSSDFQERPSKASTTTVVPKTKEASTAGPGPTEATAAEQKLKGEELKGERELKADELLAERNLTKEELLAEHQKTKKLLAASQAKVKDLLEAVRYRDRKISKLGPAGAGTVGKVVGSNVTDHSGLGIAEVPAEVHAQAKAVPKTAAKKPSAAKH